MTFHEQMRTALEMVRTQLKSEEPDFFKGETEMAVRAKFRCMSASRLMTHKDQTEFPVIYEFMAAYDADQPEDERYSKYTPQGKLTMTVDNPAVSFEPGTYYFLDFTPVES